MNQTYWIIALVIVLVLLGLFNDNKEGFGWWDQYWPYDWRYNYYYRPWYRRNPRFWRRHWWWY